MKICMFYFKHWTTDVPKNYFVPKHTPVKSNLTSYLFLYCLFMEMWVLTYNVLNQGIIQDFSMKFGAERKGSYYILNIFFDAFIEKYEALNYCSLKIKMNSRQ